MRTRVKIQVAIVAFSLLASAQVKSGSPKAAQLRLDSSACAPVPQDKSAWVPEGWAPYLAFVKLCGVGLQQTPGLYLLSIWADDYYKTLPPSAPAVKFPKPLLLSQEGRKIGELPVLFPRDPPRTLEPIFMRWVGNFPYEIKLWLDDPAVLGDRYLPPLLWDTTSGQFVQQSRKEQTPHEPASHHD